MKIRLWLARAGMVALSLLVVVGLAEVGLRIAGRSYQTRYWQRVEADYAAARPAITILTLGESTTGGLWVWVPFERSYPKQLEARLRAHYGTDRISVVVPPHLGQNTSQMVHRMPHYLAAFHPQVVILMAGVNNSWSLVESDIPRFLPVGSWRAQVFRWRTWLDDVKVLRVVQYLWAASGQAVSRVGEDLQGAPRFSEWPPKRSILGDVDPNGQPFRLLWRHDLDAMIDMAQGAGAAVVLMTYPNYDTRPCPSSRTWRGPGACRWWRTIGRSSASSSRARPRGTSSTTCTIRRRRATPSWPTTSCA